MPLSPEHLLPPCCCTYKEPRPGAGKYASSYISMTENRLPFVVTLTAILLSTVLLALILYFGRDILAPIALSAFLALLIYPIVKFLTSRRVPYVVAITLAIALLILVVVGLVVFFSLQIATFAEDWPKLESKIITYFADLQALVEEHLNIAQSRQIQLLKEATGSAAKSGAATLGGLLLAFSAFTINLVLIPLYIFLLLYYRDLWLEFFFRLTSRKEHNKVGTILREAGGMVQQYLRGLTIETLIVIVLNTAALLALGIDYAILFGVLAGLLNLIPYIGIIIGGILPTLMALITKDSVWYAFGVVASYAVIQIIDNNVIVPLIVGGRVNVNSLAAIVALLVGAGLWGITGMFLSLPIVAIMKVIFDRIDPLTPWGMILGDAIPVHSVKKNEKQK